MSTRTERKEREMHSIETCQYNPFTQSNVTAVVHFQLTRTEYAGKHSHRHQEDGGSLVFASCLI